jgi:hypothetical protein
MMRIGHSVSNGETLVLPARAVTYGPVTDAPATPTIEPTTPEVQPPPDVEPAPDEEPAEPPVFEPREDPDTEPSPVCPEGSPDEGDGEFETCRLPDRARF